MCTIRELGIELDSSLIPTFFYIAGVLAVLQSYLTELERFLIQFESCIIQLKSTLINWVYVNLAFHSLQHTTSMERQININSIN